jgi:hypothetical protein
VVSNTTCYLHLVFTLIVSSLLFVFISCLSFGPLLVSLLLYVYICMFVCMCVCMYVCVYVCMYVCVCMCVYVCMYVCVYVCMFVCVCMYICLCVCAYVCLYVCMYVCMCVCAYVCVCLYVCVCMYVRVCVYVRLYVCVYVCMCVYVCTSMFSIYPSVYLKCVVRPGSPYVTNLPPLPAVGPQSLGCVAGSPVTAPTELSRLLVRLLTLRCDSVNMDSKESVKQESGLFVNCRPSVRCLQPHINRSVTGDTEC